MRLDRRVWSNEACFVRFPGRLGSEDGHLVVFDSDPERSWEEKIYRRAPEYRGKTIAVWGRSAAPCRRSDFPNPR